MANEAGVVKSVTGGGVRALNNITGEVRNLNAGDIVYQNEKITTDSSNSKVIITQTDGKDITLLGKDTITLDQSTSNNESFGNETVADISALQQAILNGTDLNALEETAAGGGAAGGGDGVSLSEALFLQGGHISNVNANVDNIDALALAGAGDNALGVSGASVIATAEAAPIIPPIATITALSSTNATEGEDWSGPEYKFSLGDIDANGVNNLAARPTTYTFSLSGVEKGVDYEEIRTTDGNFVFEYKDANGDWVPMYGNKLTVNDPRDIENLEVRIAKLADNSIQNQGERVGDDSRFSSIDGAEQGVYQRKATVNVTSDNPQIASSSNTGTITDTDDEVSFTTGLDGKTIDTKIGNDIINLYGEIKNGSNVQSGDDDDVINLYGNLTSGSTINTGSENMYGANSHDTVNVKSGASVNGATLASEGVATFNVEKGATLNNAHINHMYGSDQTVNVNGTLNETEMNLGRGNNKVTLDGATSTNKLRVETQSGNDDIVIKNSKILGDENLTGNHNVMDIRSGQNTVTVENSELSRVDIQANGGSSDKTTVSLNATKGERLNINGKGEDDVFALKGGSTLNSSGVILGNGNNIIDIDGTKITNDIDRVKITNSSFITGDGNDVINIVNKNMEGKDIELNRVKIDSGDADYRFGSDRIYISNQGSGKIIIKDTEIKTGEGKDTIDIAGQYPYNDENLILERTKISTGDSKDIINIQEATLKQSSLITGSEYRGSYNPDKSDNDDIYIRKSYLESSTIDAGQSENELSKRDKVDINNSKIVNSHIYGGSGEDEIYITNSNVTGSQIHMGIRDERDPDHRIDDGSRGALWIVGGEMAGSKVYGSLSNGDDITIGRFESNTNDITNIRDSIIDAGGNDPFGINSRDMIRIGNARLEGTEILAKNGASTIEIYKTEIKSSYRESKIETGNDANTIDKVDITSTTIIGTDIKTNDGRDEIKIDSGSKIERSKIDTGNGNDEITIENSRIVHTQINTGDNEDVITFRNTEIENLHIETMDHKDIITIENNPYYGSKTANNVMVDTGNGNDEIVIRNTNLSDSHLLTGSGNDVISLENTDFKGSNIDTGYGADILKVSGRVSLEGSSRVNLGEGDDILEINRGTYLGGEKVDGGIGIDTLIVNEPMIDFSKVKNFEKIQLGGHAEIDASGNTTVIDDNATYLRLTTDNVKGILEGSSENVLKINGGNGDALNIRQDFNKTSSSPILGNDGKYYTEYTSNSDPSVKIEVEEGIYII